MDGTFAPECQHGRVTRMPPHEVRPRAIAGFGVRPLYVAIIIVLGQLGGVPYTEFGASASTIVRGVLPSLVVGGLVIAGMSRLMGWWKATMRSASGLGCGGGSRHWMVTWWLVGMTS
jgi:hypothetical protein